MRRQVSGYAQRPNRIDSTDNTALDDAVQPKKKWSIILFALSIFLSILIKLLLPGIYKWFVVFRMV
jgi:hypothetical protein